MSDKVLFKMPFQRALHRARAFLQDWRRIATRNDRWSKAFFFAVALTATVMSRHGGLTLRKPPDPPSCHQGNDIALTDVTRLGCRHLHSKLIDPRLMLSEGDVRPRALTNRGNGLQKVFIDLNLKAISVVQPILVHQDTPKDLNSNPGQK
ncbi:MAG: hypothetical protein C0524_12010 [Rhodobacter sp.]|nr:hypothetical protein [Rhodobacter sp.]